MAVIYLQVWKESCAVVYLHAVRVSVQYVYVVCVYSGIVCRLRTLSSVQCVQHYQRKVGLCRWQDRPTESPLGANGGGKRRRGMKSRHQINAADPGVHLLCGAEKQERHTHYTHNTTHTPAIRDPQHPLWPSETKTTHSWALRDPEHTLTGPRTRIPSSRPSAAGTRVAVWCTAAPARPVRDGH